MVLLASPRHVVLSSPPRNDWSTLDLTELEEEWKSDEDVDDLKSRDDHLYDLLERERKSAMNKLQTLLHDEGGGGGMQKNDKALKRAALDAQHAGKSVMIFATLRNDRVPDDGDGWAWNSMAAVCDKWSVSPRLFCHGVFSVTLLRLIGNAHNVNEHLYPAQYKELAWPCTR